MQRSGLYNVPVLHFPQSQIRRLPSWVLHRRTDVWATAKAGNRINIDIDIKGD
jgi:hypothetical protein